jgi:DNA-binding NarL/FixJ family response regulator
MKNMTPDELHALAEAAQSLDDYRATVDDRDNRIRNAHAAGMSKTEIADRMKLSRNTVITVIGDDEEG